jgi:hypothetical protein
LGQQVCAASIYSFSGEFTQLTASYGLSRTAYVDQGIFVGAPVTLEVSLDAGELGYVVRKGVKTFSYGSSSPTASGQVRYAELISSNFENMHSTSFYNYHNSFINEPTYKYSRGRINAGGFEISRWQYSIDPSVHVENWQVGDTAYFELDFDGGLGVMFMVGNLTLTGISSPLPPPAPVPLPGAGISFVVALAGLASAKRIRVSSGLQSSAT